jgi:predicted TIM-barrel fold metal-dependent hydrolase
MEQTTLIVDVHAHYYPPAYTERIGRPELPPAQAAPLRDQTLEERITLLDRMGIDVQLLSVSQAQPYLPQAEDAVEAAVLGNDLYTELCSEHAGRFFYFAALPLPHIEQSVAEIARVFDQKSVVGATIGCTIAGRNVDDPLFDPVYAELDRRGAKVLLHPVGQDCLVSDSDYNLAWLVGATFEDTVAALRLVLSGVADRYPNIDFIVPHFGGTLPFVLSRLLRMTGGRGGDALGRMYFDTVSGSVPALRCACEVLGTDRLLFGTDYPYSDEKEFERRLTFLDEGGIDPADLNLIKGERAAELFELARRG